MDINNLEHPYQSFIQTFRQKSLNHPLTLVKRLIGYAQQDVSVNDLQTMKYRIDELMNSRNSWMLLVQTTL